MKEDMATNQMTTEMAEDRKHVVLCFSTNVSHNFSFAECNCSTNLDGILDVSDTGGNGVHPLLQPGPAHCQRSIQQPLSRLHPSLSISGTRALVSQL